MIDVFRRIEKLHADIGHSSQLHSGAVVDGGEEGSPNSTGKASQLHSGALVDGGEEGGPNSTGKAPQSNSA
jgi:hypothetical protein